MSFEFYSRSKVNQVNSKQKVQRKKVTKYNKNLLLYKLNQGLKTLESSNSTEDAKQKIENNRKLVKKKEN